MCMHRLGKREINDFVVRIVCYCPCVLHQDQKFKRHFQTSVSACSFAASVTDAKIVRTKYVNLLILWAMMSHFDVIIMFWSNIDIPIGMAEAFSFLALCLSCNLAGMAAHDVLDLLGSARQASPRKLLR